MNVAVYVVGAAGATIVCVCAPPSDQDEKAYVVPPASCGETALTEFVEPTITVRVNGVGACGRCHGELRARSGSSRT